MSFPPGFQHPVHLLETLLHVGQIANAKTHHGRIKAIIRETNTLRIPQYILDSIRQRRLLGFQSARFHHRPIDVVDDHASGRPDEFGGKQGKVGSAAAHVNHPVPLPQTHHPDSDPFPQEMDAEAEQGIHPVVFGSHAIEMPENPLHLFFHGNLPIPEAGHTGSAWVSRLAFRFLLLNQPLGHFHHLSTHQEAPAKLANPSTLREMRAGGISRQAGARNGLEGLGISGSRNPAHRFSSSQRNGNTPRYARGGGRQP